MYYSADIGVIGGSGLYELCPDVKKIEVDTPYGKPSDDISLVEIGDRTVDFYRDTIRSTSLIRPKLITGPILMP